MDFQTPDWCCSYMATLVPTHCQSVLEPTPGEGNLVTVLKEAGLTVTSPDDFFTVAGRFDAVVMNPPFTPMRLGYEILFQSMDMADVVIALMPWLTLINSQKRTERLVAYGLKSITHLPRNAFKGSRVQTCILNLHKNFTGETNFRTLAHP